MKGPNKAEIRPEQQSEKAESCRENLWNEIHSEGSSRQKQTQEQNKKEQNKKTQTTSPPRLGRVRANHTGIKLHQIKV